MEEDVLVDVVGDLGELGVVLGAKLEDGHLHVLAEGLHELAVQLLAAFVAKRKLQALMVEGDGHERAVDVGKHLVLVIGPLSEARQEAVHALTEGVVDVRAVLMYEDAVRIVAIVGVARDVRAALQDGNAEPGGLGQTAGADGAGVAGSDDDHVVRIGIEGLGKTRRDLHHNSSGSTCPSGQERHKMCLRIIAPKSYNERRNTRKAQHAGARGAAIKGEA